MEYGIQHRSIYVVPPSPEALEWILDSFEQREIWSMFGFEGPSRALMAERRAAGNLILGVIHKVETEERIGFAVEFPPVPPLNMWEFGIAVPDPKHRDLKSAIEAGDAWAHYFFDHLRMEEGAWRIRADNASSMALATRMGYRPYLIWDMGGVKQQFFRMDQARWAERLAQIQQEEDLLATGEDLFVTLEPPFRPHKPFE
ncbi:MAG: GNAT family N-acetyltransferase [Deltaproteobacteria bacterium]|nr:GNAT family N-acetyltransferase [Deltaproteobacteria bacterium]